MNDKNSKTNTKPEIEKSQNKKINFPMTKNQIVVYVVVILAALSAYYFKGFLIAATVNNKPVYRLSVLRDLEKQSGQQALDNLITQTLIKQEATKQNITVTDEEITARVDEIGTTIEAQTGQTLDDILKMQNMDRKDLDTQLKTQLVVEKLLGDKTTVTDEEVATYVEENKEQFGATTDEATQKEQAKGILKNQKLSSAYTELVNNLKTGAKINYFVEY